MKDKKHHRFSRSSSKKTGSTYELEPWRKKPLRRERFYSAVLQMMRKHRNAR